MGTTAKGFRYPDATDRVNAGNTAMANLAGDVDSWLGSTAWTALPTLGTGWSDYATGGFQTSGYRKEAGGRVFLRGVLKNATTTVTQSVITTLPAGFRPLAGRMFAIPAGGGVARIDVTSAGVVTLVDYRGTTGSAAYVSLDQVSWDIS